MKEINELFSTLWHPESHRDIKPNFIFKKWQIPLNFVTFQNVAQHAYLIWKYCGGKSIIFVSPSFRYALVWHSQALIGHSYPLLWAVNYCSTISSFKHGPKGVPPKNSNGLKTLFLSPLLKKYINFYKANFSISLQEWFYFEDLQSKSPQNKHF